MSHKKKTLQWICIVAFIFCSIGLLKKRNEPSFKRAKKLHGEDWREGDQREKNMITQVYI